MMIANELDCIRYMTLYKWESCMHVWYKEFLELSEGNELEQEKWCYFYMRQIVFDTVCDPFYHYDVDFEMDENTFI